MPQIIDLDALVPEDIEFHYRGEVLRIPGDIDVEDTFKLIRLLDQASKVEANGSLATREKVNLDVQEALTALFRQRHPDLKKLPFGTIAYQHVLKAVLEALGLQVVEDPPKPKPNRQARRATSRSRRSSGSSK